MVGDNFTKWERVDVVEQGASSLGGPQLMWADVVTRVSSGL